MTAEQLPDHARYIGEGVARLDDVVPAWNTCLRCTGGSARCRSGHDGQEATRLDGLR